MLPFDTVKSDLETVRRYRHPEKISYCDRCSQEVSLKRLDNPWVKGIEQASALGLFIAHTLHKVDEYSRRSLRNLSFQPI